MKFSAILLFAVMPAVLCVATFVEQGEGTAFAARHIYHSWWFAALWAVTAAASLATVVRRRLWKRHAAFALHVSLLIILAGAAVSFLTSQSGMMHIRQGQAQNMFLDDGSRMQPLPFALRLDSFRIKYYPGTSAPADYLSHVEVMPTEHSTLNTPHSSLHTPHSALISMNRILSCGGYRFYQTSYDDDCRGTVLTVKYDPYGTPLTYCGYMMLALSMVAVLLSRKGRFRRLLRQLGANQAKIVCTLLLILYSGAVTARSLPTVNAGKAEVMARRQIVYNDRVAPFATMAHDFMLKVYGAASYHGLSAEQVVCGWMTHPEVWKNEPMIKVKDRQLQERLGAEDGYIALQSLFDSAGNYRLTQLTADKDLNPKSLQAIDEKAGIIIMLTQGSLFTPLPDGAAPLSDSRITAEIAYNRMAVVKILFMANLALGILSLIVFAVGGARTVRCMVTVLRVCFILSLAALVAFYCLRWYVSCHVPMGNGYETMLFMSLVIMIASGAVSRRVPLMLCIGLLLSGFTLLVAHLGDSNPQITQLMPVLNSPLLCLHVSLVMMAYALLGMTFIMAVVYFVLGAAEKFKVSTNAGHSTPITPHSTLTIMSRLLLYPAEFLLAAGIFVGAVWANVSWGTYWSWDPKEVWALITMLVYAVPFHRILNSEHRTLYTEHSYHLFMLAAFSTVLMTYFGVNFFLGGMHSYA